MKIARGIVPAGDFLAEGEGFKPPIPEKGIPDFESSAIDHSANLPSKREQTRACSQFVELARTKEVCSFLESGCKGTQKIWNCQNIGVLF